MSDVESTRTDRVAIDESVIEVYKDLTGTDSKDNDIEQTPFETYKEVFMFAVALGFEHGERRPLSGGKKHTIRREVFSDSDLAFLKALAIAETGDVQVLGRFGEILTIAEEYAHGGLSNLKAALKCERSIPLWELVRLLI
jgi:dnd system-associated protein 4